MEWLTDPSLSVCIFCSLQTFVLHNNRCILWERTTVGGGVVKVLILQFFWDMEMVCTWSHKSRLSRILHFLQRCCLFPRMLYFLLSILEKKTCLYTMILMPAMNFALYCCTYYHMYIYIYNIIYIYIIYMHTHTVWPIYYFFRTSLCFSKNMYLILNIHECNFQPQILHYLKVFCILSCCSWVLFKKEHVKIEHALLQKMV